MRLAGQSAAFSSLSREPTTELDVQANAPRANAALLLCREALARGSLIRDGRHWRFGRRRFSNATIKRLIDEGTAVRAGNEVTRAGFPGLAGQPVRFGPRSP